MARCDQKNKATIAGTPGYIMLTCSVCTLVYKMICQVVTLLYRWVTQCLASHHVSDQDCYICDAYMYV